MRTFIAVPLPEPIRNAVTNLLAEARRSCAPTAGDDARLVSPEALHVTLLFLGKTSEAQLADLRSSLPSLIAAFPRFSLSLERSGSFGGRASALWLGVGGDLVGLRMLRERLVGLVSSFGFNPEERAYVPHLTVARLSTTSHSFERELASSMERTAFPFTAEEVTLFRSDTLPEGARYTPLVSCPLS